MADEDKPYDAGDPKDVKAAIRDAQRWEDRKDRVISAVMASEDGRRWIREQLELSQIGTNPFNTDALKMAFNCGQMNAGQRLMADVMNAVPDLYMRMMSEDMKAQKQEEKDEDNG